MSYLQGVELARERVPSFDRYPFSLPADEIHRSTVESTWIEGELVYSRTA